MSEEELREFYELCQAYRHTPLVEVQLVCDNFDKLVDFVNAMLAKREQQLESYRIALTPQEWRIEHSVGWRNNMFDTLAAFAAIREVAEKS